MFSVIIPTLQRSEALGPLVAMYARHPRVSEILIINNEQRPLAWDSPKVRVLQQSENIYVNPAWNLGMLEAREPYLCISNDDIYFDPKIIDYAAKVLDKGKYSLLGPSTSALNGRDGQIRHGLCLSPKRPFGTLMFMVADTYVPIPPEPLIWSGDDWLFWNRDKPAAEIRGIAIRTEMGTSAKEYSMSSIKSRDWNWWLVHRRLIPFRLWHLKVKLLLRLKLYPIRLARMVCRLFEKST